MPLVLADLVAGHCVIHAHTCLFITAAEWRGGGAAHRSGEGGLAGREE